MEKWSIRLKVSLKTEHCYRELYENGRRHKSYTEGLTKTINQRLNSKPRLIFHDYMNERR